jgi:BirA family biotin operon repressor/biotin-[acetyl-CoA-carboxylase] ligase
VARCAEDEPEILTEGDIGRNIIFLDEVESTNTFCVKLAELGAPNGTVVVSESQTKGRGRLGREWASPRGGNIYMSILLRLGISIKDATPLTLMAAVASTRSLREKTGLMVEIKWPNDLMANGRKLGGILTETKARAGRAVLTVLGIGINVNIEPADLPEGVRETATSVKHETKRSHSRAILIASLLEEINSWYSLFSRGGRDPVLREWKRLSSTLGNHVRVETGRETVFGLAEDINGDGNLLLRLRSGRQKSIRSGDVKTIRKGCRCYS